MPPDPVIRLVSQLPWDVVAAGIASGAPAILPVGAGAKQHGLHMPMGVDALQAEHFGLRLADVIGAFVWPTLTYGAYPAFVRYPGSVSLSDATFEAVVSETVRGLIASGSSRVLVVDTGISTIAPVRRALAGMPASVRHLAICDGPRYRAMRQSLAGQRPGTHADEIETSILLTIHPEVVDMGLAQPSPPRTGRPVPGPLEPYDRNSPNYSPSGSTGDPTLATAEKGRAMVEAILADLAEGAAQVIPD